MPKPTKVLFVVPYSLHRAPSQRFRVELFLPYLKKAGIEYSVATFLDEKTFSILYSDAAALKKAWGILKGFLKRLVTLFFTVPGYDYIFIHREASPVGPPFFEFIAAKVFRKKIIYDFDDAIWVTDSSNKLLNWLKAFWKIHWICKWAYKVVGGNDYLCNYARRYNPNVVLIPTCVDIENRHNRLKDQNETPLTIGWTGSHSTLKYLEPLAPILEGLAEEFSLRVVIICNKKPAFSFDGLEYVRWNEETEIDDLLEMHIGVMPLPADPWSEGKCGFKLIQYLSLGIPAVASPVGVNSRIIGEDHSNLLCTTEQEWKNALRWLIQNKEMREKIGKEGREKMIASYSIQAYAGKFVDLFA